MSLIRVSPKSAPDPVYVQPDDISMIIGPVAKVTPVSPGNTKTEWVIHLVLRNAQKFDIAFSIKDEAQERMTRVLKEHNASFTED